VKTKNFHWHVSGRHFRDYHLLLDQQSDDIFATTDQLAERVRKLGGTTLRSIGRSGNCRLSTTTMRAMCRRARCCANDGRQQACGRGDAKAHKLCDDHEDSGTAGCWKPSSTKPSGAPGSCSKPAARKVPTRPRAFSSEVETGSREEKRVK